MELFKLLGKVAIDNNEANKNIDETTGKAEKSESKMNGAFKKIGGGAVAMAKAGVVAIGAVAAGLGAMVKSAISNYAEYEQLVGGVETLFKDSGSQVIKFANNAYKTAGLSANEYMTTVTGFSASLLQSLDGDTAKAAAKADLAITDMSDNANKMGTNMGSIQDAYQGFAKQNYTMLDNLKLGYGGTKEEMSRLLEDAEKISGFKYDLSSYGDLVDAIHVVQTEMGITGTTALEASTTIQGSIGMMSSAWANFSTGMADPSQDFDALLGNLIDSVIAVADNVIPRIAQTLPRLVQGLAGLIQTLAPYIPAIIGELLPALLSGAATLLQELIKGIPALFLILAPILVESIKTILSTVIGASNMSDVFDGIFSAGFLESLGWFIDTALPNMLSSLKDTAIETFSGKFEALKEIFGKVKEILQPLVELYLTQLMNNFQVFMSILNTVVLPVLGFLFDAFMDIVGVVLDSIQPAIASMIDNFTWLYEIINEAIMTYILPTVELFIQMIKDLWAENKDKINLIGELFKTIFNSIAEKIAWFVEIVKDYIYPLFIWFVGFVQSNLDTIKVIFQSVFDVIGGIISFFIALFKGNWSGMWDAIKKILSGAFDYIKNVFNLVCSFFLSIGTKIWSIVSGAFEKVASTIKKTLTDAKDSVMAIFNDIKNGISDKLNEAKDTVSSIINKILEFFRFDWELPKLKMPHLKISGSFSLAPPSVPKVGVDWYKNGGVGVLTQPTAFGINPLTGAMRVGGEAGDEAIAPVSVLQKYIAEAVASQNSDMIAILNLILKAIYSLDDGLGVKLYNAMLGLKFEVNNREFARLVRQV